MSDVSQAQAPQPVQPAQPVQQHAMYPAWLTRNESGAFIVDADKAYPVALKALEIEGQPTQYDLECAYQCIKMKVQDLVSFTGTDPREEGKILAIVFDSQDKEKWRQSNFEEGKGAKLATQGLEAKAHYDRIRSKLR